MESSSKQKGILLVNLGSPKSTDVRDVRDFLEEFLMDPFVMDYPKWIRWLIVHIFILPFRPIKSANSYKSIWWGEGSPLIVLSQRLRTRLQRISDFPITLSMRYGSPSITEGLEELLEHNVSEILLISLYPHYAMSTTQTIEIEVRRILTIMDPLVQLRVMAPYYQDPNYIATLVHSAKKDLAWRHDHILFSYHGIPERHLHKVDPTGDHCLKNENCCQVKSSAHSTCYRHQIIRTTELFVEKAGIQKNNYSIAFQSRLGRDAWLQPYTSSEIKRLAETGVKKLLVLCPSFVTDCLETLEEIEIQGREIFLEAGGEDFRMGASLNVNEDWVETLNNWSKKAFELNLN